jgi:hypothetical protein
MRKKDHGCKGLGLEVLCGIQNRNYASFAFHTQEQVPQSSTPGIMDYHQEYSFARYNFLVEKTG